MLKHRLSFGALMTVVFAGVVVLDGWLDGSATASTVDDKQVQGTLLAILVAVTLGLGGLEFSRLAAAKGLVVLNPATVCGLVGLSTCWYWPQFIRVGQGPYILFVVALTLVGMLVQQYLRFGPDGVLANCGAGCFALVYLGLLGAFVLGLRVEIGLWQTLMTVFAVKTSDIGAYTFGSIFGKRRFAPRISPGKTWEGLAGAMCVAVVVSVAFAAVFGIMAIGLACLFGACMAGVGQLSDLVESMLKRDAQEKDSSNCVPGFGGILDVVDSPLFAMPFAYLFFKVVS